MSNSDGTFLASTQPPSIRIASMKRTSTDKGKLFKDPLCHLPWLGAWTKAAPLSSHSLNHVTTFMIISDDSLWQSLSCPMSSSFSYGNHPRRTYTIIASYVFPTPAPQASHGTQLCWCFHFLCLSLTSMDGMRTFNPTFKLQSSVPIQQHLDDSFPSLGYQHTHMHAQIQPA